jgi:starch phosphorylase
MLSYFFSRPLPEGLEGLDELALDLRWTWSHFSDRLWEFLDPEAWELTNNPYYILESVAQARLEQLAADRSFREQLRGWMEQRQQYLRDPGWFGQSHGANSVKGIAYFSMEFGLSEALPIYSGGLGILAGDYLKAASDLGVPVAGIGLLYQQGYFRQILAPDGWQLEAFPYNDPTSLPVVPMQDRQGGWLRLRLDLPGRPLFVRVWLARVGKVKLYLLDSNDPLNNAPDRGITATLYPAGQRPRLTQEIILGIGGWRLLEELGLEVDMCHLNEGHAAFAVVARAMGFMRRAGCPFPAALWATRAGNVFTTHTPVEAAFDRFEPALLLPYAKYLADLLKVPEAWLMGLGRRNPEDAREPFNMAYLAVRGCGQVNGVSRLHGTVSRKIFQPLFPEWPEAEVPIRHVTNGVHVPSWDSPEADELWTCACGKGRWTGTLEDLCGAVESISDTELWSFRAAQRQHLLRHVRDRLARQLQEHGAPSETLRRVAHVLDPNRLTLGFARRFTEYKRPTLLLRDPERLRRILCDPKRPVQLIVAGKAHPNDDEGKHMVQAMAQFAARPDLFDHVVFLEDYDMSAAGYLVAGIYVWLNMPRRPWEACGTSGMKVLVNGGLNLSELDGWWAEAYSPEVGWALGDGRQHDEPGWDEVEADQLYRILETQVIPEFYDRNGEGIPRAWLRRVRASMVRLTAQFSSNRMLREYCDTVYVPAASAYRRRAADGARLAQELQTWSAGLAEQWGGVRFGEVRTVRVGDSWHVEAQVYCGDLHPESLRVELYADPVEGQPAPVRIAMDRKGPLPGAVNAYRYVGEASASRPAGHYTPRIVPHHPEATVPLEAAAIFWKR